MHAERRNTGGTVECITVFAWHEHTRRLRGRATVADKQYPAILVAGTWCEAYQHCYQHAIRHPATAVSTMPHTQHLQFECFFLPERERLMLSENVGDRRPREVITVVYCHVC